MEPQAQVGPFERYELAITYGEVLLPAAEALFLVAQRQDAPVARALASRALIVMDPHSYTTGLLPALPVWPAVAHEPVASVELIARDLADVLVEAILEADRPRRLRLGRLLADVAFEASQARERRAA